MAMHTARSMLASADENHRSAETVLFVCKLVAPDELQLELERMVTPRSSKAPSSTLHTERTLFSAQSHASASGPATARSSNRGSHVGSPAKHSAVLEKALTAAKSPSRRPAASLRQSAGAHQHKPSAAAEDAAVDGAMTGRVDRQRSCSLATFLTLSRTPPVPQSLTASEDAVCLLEGRAREWDFDTFEVDRLTHGHALVAVGEHLGAPAAEALGLRSCALRAFLSSIEGSYRTDVAYHTATHAADVVHGAFWLLNARALHGAPTPLLQLAVLIAAAAHDVAHPGVNADFLIRTGDPLALLYNDQSILENMHAAICFQILADAETNLLEPLPDADKAQLRALVIKMILETDMKKHYAILRRLHDEGAEATGAAARALNGEHGGAGSAAAGVSASEADEVLQRSLGALMHAADLSGPCKPSTVIRWSRRVAEEFFEQGEREKALGLKVSDGFDRATAGTKWASRNGAFLAHVVRPLYQALQAATPHAELGPAIAAIDTALVALGDADVDMPVT